MLNDNHYIDKFFRESLHNYEVASSDILWERLENGLSNIQPVNSKSENIKKVYFSDKKIKYIYFAASAAVILLLIIAGNKFLNIDLNYNTEQSKNITSKNITSKNNSIQENINSRFDNNDIERNIFVSNSYLTQKNKAIFTLNNNVLSENKDLNFPYFKIKNKYSDNIYVVENNNNIDKNIDIVDKIKDAAKENNIETEEDFLADNNIEVLQKNLSNSAVNIASGGAKNNISNINQSNAEQVQPVISNNYISRTAIKDSIKAAEVAEATKVREDNNVLRRNSSLMRETFGIDTTNNQEIQELKINDRKPTQALVFPNVFTPNNDGINDYFTILGIDECPLNKLVISDRYGKLVYETINYNNDWDGRNVEDGVYYFVFVCKISGNEFVKKGMITVLR